MPRFRDLGKLHQGAGVGAGGDASSGSRATSASRRHPRTGAPSGTSEGTLGGASGDPDEERILRHRAEAEKRLKKLGRPPANVLDANEWAFRLALELAHQALVDPEVPSERLRRKEVLECLDRCPKLLPYAEIAKAESRLRGDDATLKSSTTGPELEDASKLTTRDGPPKAKRGRPPKRSLL